MTSSGIFERRWIRSGQTTAVVTAGAASSAPIDDKYADKLDDELAETDD